MIKLLSDMDLENKKVLLRVDYNVPVKDGAILDDNRITSSFETIDYLLNQNCKIILLSHFGKIKKEEDKKDNSLKIVYDYIKGLDRYDILFCDTPMGEKLDDMAAKLEDGQILLVENTRFTDLQGNLESSCDVQLSTYWADLADVYVDDAFGCMHRNHASVTGIPKYLPGCIGLLTQKEIKNLSELINIKERPFVVVMGGAKLDDKIDLIYTLIEKADFILLGGGIANTFLKANGYNVGESLISPDKLNDAKAITEEFKDKIILPKDVIASPTFSDVKYQLKTLDELTSDDVIGDIGVEAIKNYSRIINEAKLIFVNGTVGLYEQKEYSNGTGEILRAVANSNAKKIVGGGDAASSVKKYNLEDKIDFISTGGGASLTYIAKGSLPGLDALNQH